MTTKGIKSHAAPVVTQDGEIIGERYYTPAVFAMSGIDLARLEYPALWVFALTSKRGCKRGYRYLVSGVTSKGELLLTGVTGTHPMTDFVEALVAERSEPANDNNS